MKPRRRRWFRDETLAPWVTVAVILAMWWGASWLIRPIRPAESTLASDFAGADTAVDRSRTAPGDAPGPSDARKTLDARSALDERRASSAPRDSFPVLLTSSGGSHAIPVAGVEPSQLTSTFHEARGGGSRRHEAMDILAPRGTPVLASVDGRIVKLFSSAAGGLTIYQFDDDERLCYYYAHLDSYAPDLTEGQVVRQGQIIGFVGTTGNAPPDTPHLHFAVTRLGPDKRWWEGEALDPLTFLR